MSLMSASHIREFYKSIQILLSNHLRKAYAIIIDLHIYILGSFRSIVERLLLILIILDAIVENCFPMTFTEIFAILQLLNSRKHVHLVCDIVFNVLLPQFTCQ